MSKFIGKLKRNVRWTLIQLETFIMECHKQHRGKIVGVLHIFNLSAVLGLVALLSIYDLVFVLPSYLETIGVAYILNLIPCFFVIFNILGNLWKCAHTNTSFVALPKDRQQPHPTEVNLWHLCTHCQIMVPPRTRHCSICKVCILKRDHHCYVTNTCIGHANQRYFVAMLLHCTIGCVIAFAYNLLHLWEQRHDLARNPEAFLVLYLFLWTLLTTGNATYKRLVINLIVLVFNAFGLILSGGMLLFQLIMISRGSCMKSPRSRNYDFGFWLNTQQVLGKRMFWTMLSPFLHSQLPQDGTRWQQPLDEEHKKPA